MKEAAGEANLTVVAIILIAVIVAVATPLINSLMKNASGRSCCTDAGGVWEGSSCYGVDTDGNRSGSGVKGKDLVKDNGTCKDVTIDASGNISVTTE